MTTPTSLPHTVRFNHGLGFSMWLLFGTVIAMVILGLIATEAPVEAILITCGFTAILILLGYALMPRVTISPAEGTIRTRKGSFPFAAIAEVRFIKWVSAGHWAEFYGDDGKKLTGIALAGTVFSNASTEQWVTLRHVVWSAASARVARPSTKPLPPPGSISPIKYPMNVRVSSVDHALGVLDAQINWVMAGKKPGSDKAPLFELARAVIYTG